MSSINPFGCTSSSLLKKIRRLTQAVTVQKLQCNHTIITFWFQMKKYIYSICPCCYWLCIHKICGHVLWFYNTCITRFAFTEYSLLSLNCIYTKTQITMQYTLPEREGTCQTIFCEFLILKITVLFFHFFSFFQHYKWI